MHVYAVCSTQLKIMIFIVETFFFFSQRITKLTENNDILNRLSKQRRTQFNCMKCILILTNGKIVRKARFQRIRYFRRVLMLASAKFSIHFSFCPFLFLILSMYFCVNMCVCVCHRLL